MHNTYGIQAIRSSSTMFPIRHGVDDDARPEWRDLDVIASGVSRQWFDRQEAKRLEAKRRDDIAELAELAKLLA
tara:strand:- start:478 stop:699 length:222 start_codon:yes stop_codon:yes gene_type:complete